MWTFDRVLNEFDEWVLRSVLAEVNNLICGKGADAANPNPAGIDAVIWRKLLVRGGVTSEGFAKLSAGERISQRDTKGPFDPYTVNNIAALSRGAGAVLSDEEVDHVLVRVLKYQGRLDENGAVIAPSGEAHGGHARDRD